MNKLFTIFISTVILGSCVSESKFENYKLEIDKRFENFEVTSSLNTAQKWVDPWAKDNVDCDVDPPSVIKGIALNYDIGRITGDNGFPIGEEQVIHIEPYPIDKGYMAITMEIERVSYTEQNVLVRFRHTDEKKRKFAIHAVSIDATPESGDGQKCWEWDVKIEWVKYGGQNRRIKSPDIPKKGKIISPKHKLDVMFNKEGEDFDPEFTRNHICRIVVNDSK